MKDLKSTGWIDFHHQGQVHLLNPNDSLQRQALKKAFFTDKAIHSWVRNRYPELELVDSAEAILQDHSIQHIIISAPPTVEKNMIGKALKTGKSVQVIQDL